MWYKRKTDPVSQFAVMQMGLNVIFYNIHEIIHEDDLKLVSEQLFEYPYDVIKELFEETTLEQQ